MRMICIPASHLIVFHPCERARYIQHVYFLVTLIGKCEHFDFEFVNRVSFQL